MGFESLSGKMDVALHMLCSCIVFIFLVTSAPISQFKGKGMNEGGASKVACLTVWGLKNKCNENDYDYAVKTIECSRTRQLFQATEAFYIIAVVISLLACILSGLFFLGMRTKPALFAFGGLEIVFSLIPWACMSAVWSDNKCTSDGVYVNATNGQLNGIPLSTLLRDGFKHSAGYGLTIAAWCIQIIGLLLLIFIKM